MERVIIKEKQQGNSKMMEALVKAKEDSEKRLRERMPPKEIREMINTEVEKTFEVNGGVLDTQAFRLGMYAMWFLMQKIK